MAQIIQTPLNSKNLYSLTPSEMPRIFGNLAPIHVKNIFSHIYKSKGEKSDALTEIINNRNIPKKIKEIFIHNYQLYLPRIKTTKEDKDHTVKFLMEFQDGLTAETVLVPFPKKYTVCLSSQVGCAMNCKFCFTGTQGLKRHLKVHEIVGQYLIAWQWLKKHRPHQALKPSIVFMGQGEPLHNFDEVKKAIEIFTHDNCLQIGTRNITLSTAGYLPGVKRLKELPRINYALSFHSPFDEERNQLIPINQRFPLQTVLKELFSLPRLKKQFLNIEYLLMGNHNDSDHHAHGLGKMLQDREVIINLIPFNPFPGAPYQRPSDEKIEHFKKILVTYKLPTMIRTTKGSDILAACGQLTSSHESSTQINNHP